MMLLFKSSKLRLLTLSGCLCIGAHADLGSLLEPIEQPVPPVTKAPRVTSTQPERPELPALIDTRVITERLGLLLQARFNEPGKLKLSFLKAWRPLQPRTGDWHVEITEYPAAGLTSSFLLAFKLEVDGQDAGSFRLPVRAQLWREIFFARRTLNTGTVVAEDELMIREVDLLDMHNPSVAATADLRDFEMVRTVAAGRPLLWRDVKTIPLVREGEVIEAVCDDGLLHISMKAVALEDGGRGDFIRVRNLQTKKDIQAEVIDDKKARVHF
ncbi:MAG: flagellar basal body P-ring formation chaperone FlgA [Opitutales bacterium]